MLVAGIAILAALALTVAVPSIVRRRRAARRASLSLGTTRRSAGVSHLATGVSELSDLGLHLRTPGAPRRRLGELLGSSSGASR